MMDYDGLSMDYPDLSRLIMDKSWIFSQNPGAFSRGCGVRGGIAAGSSGSTIPWLWSLCAVTVCTWRRSIAKSPEIFQKGKFMV